MLSHISAPARFSSLKRLVNHILIIDGVGDSITKLKGVGDAVAKKFKIIGIETIEDLFEYYPRRYDDFSIVTEVAKLRPGMFTIEAKINNVVGRYARRGMHITEALATDKTGSIRLIWFNQPYRASAIQSDKQYYVSGEFGLNRQQFSMVNPSVELTSSFPINTARNRAYLQRNQRT